MGVALSCCGSCLGSCCGSAALSGCCRACQCKCILGPKMTNLFYVFILLATTITALVLQFNQYTLNARNKWDGDDYCEGDPNTDCSGGSDAIQYQLCDSDKCSGQFATYRLSFTLMCFFAGMFFLTAFPSKVAFWAHHGFWYAKLLLIGVVFIGAAFGSDQLFSYYAWVARFVAPFFLVYQMVYIIDLGYSKNKAWCDYDDDNKPLGPSGAWWWPFCDFGIPNEGGNAWKAWLVICSLFFALAAIGGWAAMYKVFPQDNCAFNPLAITTILFMSVLNTAISISKVAPHGALFTSALIAAYTTFLTWNALSYMPYEECNPFAGDTSVAHIIIGLAIAAGSVGYIAFARGAAEQGGGGLGNMSQYGTAGASKTTHGNDQLSPAPDSVEGDPEPKSFWSYHLVMFLVSVYFAMLLTNWGQINDSDGEPSGASRTGAASAWVSLGSAWLCSILYFWTLVAPWCCPDRDFGVEFDN